MTKLTEKELIQLEGGGVSLWIGCGIVALAILIAGIIDGFTRPLSCHE